MEFLLFKYTEKNINYVQCLFPLELNFNISLIDIFSVNLYMRINVII